MSCPAHAELALAVAHDLGCALDGSDAAIAALAAELAPGDAFAELEAVRALCETFGQGPALLLPDVLRARAGDPAAVALAVAAAAQHAGLAIDVVAARGEAAPEPATARGEAAAGRRGAAARAEASAHRAGAEPSGPPGDALYLAHPEATTIVDPSGRLLDGRTLGVDLEWRCAHETAATILDRIAARAERTGDLPLATAARALTLTLPLSDDSRDVRVREHARLLARLN